MQRIEFETPFDYALSPYSGWTRSHWEEAFFVLMRAIVRSASPGFARQKIPGPKRSYGLAADEFEGFARSFIMAGPWLALSNTGAFEYKGEVTDVGRFYRKGILAGTDPDHEEYWGEFGDYSPHLVQCASLTWALYLSRRHTWNHFSDTKKRQVADYLYQCTKAKYWNNNWLLFNVVTNAGLKKLGMPFSQRQIDENMKACESMYLGQGWYRDGELNRIDYYNAWAFHYYTLIWSILDGHSKPRASEKYKERVNEFLKSFKYFFSKEGNTPCFGRSMTYRFGYLGPVALAQYLLCLDLDPGEVRTMTGTGINFFLSKEILTNIGHLSMGYVKPSSDILEDYVTGGSPYWAGKAFNILLIPENNEFWAVKEEPLPIHQRDYSLPITECGFIIIGDSRSGHVQLINQKSMHELPNYTKKYTNFVYSSIFNYECRKENNHFNCDTSLQYCVDGVNFRQRQKINCLYCGEGFAASRDPMKGVDDNGQVYTYILVKDDYIINLHRIETSKGMSFREGGYSQGFDSGEPEVVSSDRAIAIYADGKVSYLRNLYGYENSGNAHTYTRLVDGSNGRYNLSMTPVLSYQSSGKNPLYLACIICGRIGSDPLHKLDCLVTRFNLIDNKAFISFYDGEMAFVQVGHIEKVLVDLNGKHFEGRIVVARVSGDGKESSVIKKSGSTMQKLKSRLFKKQS